MFNNLTYLFQIRIDSLKENWSGSIVVGIMSMTLEQIKSIPLPSTAFAMKGPIWVVASDYLCVQGTKVFIILIKYFQKFF